MASTNATGLTLTEVNDAIGPAMTGSETAVRTMIASLGDGANVSVAQLTELQYEISVYSIVAGCASAIMKECADTMKSVVQKI